MQIQKLMHFILKCKLDMHSHRWRILRQIPRLDPKAREHSH